MNIAQFLPSTAMQHGDRPAVSIGTERLYSYAELEQRVGQLAHQLRHKFGLRERDRVALAMTNCPAYIEVLLACWRAGLCAVPLNPKLHTRELLYIIENAEAGVCFATGDLAPGLAPGTPGCLKHVVNVDDAAYQSLMSGPSLPTTHVEAGEVAWLFYTSGTTGRPKGAMLSHGNLLAMSLRYYADIEQVSEKSCYIHLAPTSHGTGLYALPHLMKGSNQVIPVSRGFDVEELIALLAHYDGVTFYVAPTMLTRLTNHPRAGSINVGHINTIYYGGAPTYVEDIKRSIRVFGPRLYQIYGQGESPMTGTGLSKTMHVDTSHPAYEQRLASVGMPRTGMEVRVVNADGEDCAAGELGEVVFRSDVTMLGYWKNEEATAKAIQDGWLYSGDIGSLDAWGLLTLRDRSKDVVISGGSNIYPREVEEILLMDERVLEVSVVGRPHPDWGEEVVAFVVPRPGRTIVERDLDQLCLDHIARFKRPKDYIVLDALPKSNYGKILKSELRKHFQPVGPRP